MAHPWRRRAAVEVTETTEIMDVAEMTGAAETTEAMETTAMMEMMEMTEAAEMKQAVQLVRYALVQTIAAAGFRWKFGKMNSPRLHNPQNQAPRPE